jgi:FMN phosphatase YigB (HAD superfamily)
MTTETEVVFLFDVDNTLLDNDRVESDIRLYIEGECGVQSRDRYIAIFEELRAKLGYSDYLGTLQHYRNEERFIPYRLSFC